MTKKTLFGFFALLVTITMYSCSDMNFYLPPGPQGDDGASTYEIWKEQAEQGKVPGWSKDKTTLADFLIYIKGEKGDKGADGLSAYELWKKYISKGDVANPRDPSTTWKAEENSEADFWRFLTGRDGSTPSVGQNNNWWIDGKDTGVLARGANGKDALSSYEIWKKEVEADRITWEKDKVELTDYFRYLTGKDGVDGVSPHIGPGPQFHWFIGTTDTGVPAKGNNGKSAYELWKEELKNTDLKNPITGESWPKAQDTMADFWRFMQGPKGDKGESAYAIWKALVLKQEVLVPGSDTEKWPKDQVDETHFWKFLTGKDGVNGLSAYELWKQELKERAGTDNKLMDYRNDKAWDPQKDTMDDFLDFLRGKDGKDGADGKPGAPGKPGGTIVVQAGVPNVIAQYSLQSKGEFVNSYDGSVTYKVFDKEGNPAANAQVKGLPGIRDKEKIYTSTADGTFVVPKADLPEIQDSDMRWGKTTYVKIGTEPAVESAPNTYVPNQIKTRVVAIDPTKTDVKENKPFLDGSHNITFKVERRLNPDDAWTLMPNYIPGIAEMTFEVVLTSDENPENVTTTILGEAKRTDEFFKATARRYVKENKAKYYNNYTQAWDNNTKYFTLREKTNYYGEKAVWNGVCEMAPYQCTPLIKSITLKGKGTSTDGEDFFNSGTGELDYSDVDLNMFYFKEMEYSKDKTTGREKIYPVLMPREQAEKEKAVYAVFYFKSKAGDQEASSISNLSSYENKSYGVQTTYLNSIVRVRTIYESWSTKDERKQLNLFPNVIEIGTLVKDGTGTDKYKVENKVPTLPEIKVTFTP